MTTATSAFATPPNGHFRSMTVGEIARLLDAQILGDPTTLITGVAGLDATAPGAISFIEDEKLLATALSSSAAAIIAPASMLGALESQAAPVAPRRTNRRSLSSAEKPAAPLAKPVVLTGNPRLAFAKVMEFMQPVSLPEKGIHPTAIIEKDAHIGTGVTIREHCYIGHHAHIGDGAVIYPHVVVGDGAQIGDASVLFPSVVLNHHVHVGKRVRIHSGSVIGGDGFGYVFDGKRHHKVPQVGTVIIEDDVEIGANVCIDRATIGATRIGEGTKIDNLVQIAHNVQIGRNCILCGQVGLSGSVVVEDGVVMAGQAGLRDHVKIGKGAILGAKAGIMADVGPGEFVSGAPAVPNRDYLKINAASRKLPEMARQVRRLEKTVEELRSKLENGS
ncbi:MAG: UDP-3-O-(3-hydroxymyristoyl)glucosamine N-acyltransferase [Armatimonadetes bacterium]|nr:UDP-3-O-(3-hydroxymyristoyl)glucosamine N-acyltransferase [Armatimonadota bacterium]